MTVIEFVLWGIPRGETDPLHAKVLTCTTDRDRVETVRALATRDGWHGFTIQRLDGRLPNFAGSVK